MSRTYRQPPHWANAQLANLLEEIPTTPYLKSHLKWLKVTIARYRGQDGTCVTPVHDAEPRAPKGYGYLGTEGAMGKRFSKRRTARIMRRRGSKETRQQLFEIYENQQLDAFEAQMEALADSWYDDTPMLRKDDDLGDHFDEHPEDHDGSCYDEDAYNLSYSEREYDRGILRDMLRRRSAESIINLVRDIKVDQEIQHMARDACATSDGGKTLGDILGEAIQRRNTWNKPSWRYGHGELHVHGTLTGRFSPTT